MKNKGVTGFELATYRHAHQKQACTLLYTCGAFFFSFFWLGCFPLPYIKTNISSLVYQKQHHQQQACTLLYKQAYQQGTQPPWACR